MFNIKNLFACLASVVLMLAIPSHAHGALYFVSAEQGWDPVNSLEFTDYGNDNYDLITTLNSSTQFKISTQKPAASMSTNEKWAYFDEGCFTADEPLVQESGYVKYGLTEGVQNISAPGTGEMKIHVDLEYGIIEITMKGYEPTPNPEPDPDLNYYLVGGFNGWNIDNVVKMNYDGNGIYSKVVDFTQNNIFKVSTVKPGDASQEDMWAQFDKGAWCYAEAAEVTVNTEIPLMMSTLNMEAPVNEVCTVVINSVNKTIKFVTEGGTGGGGNDPIVNPYQPSGTLPVLYINTENNQKIESKETYLKATYWLDPMGDESVAAIGSAEEPLTTQIKGRGNYTWTGFAKKPYRLKLDSKQPLLGMKKSKHFALLAHADDDKGFMRNILGFELSRRIGMAWTPADAPVELVLNGEYLGLYFLTETIRVDKDRVNVFEQLDNDDTDVTGGWLVEIDNYDTDPHVDVYDGTGYNIYFTYKTPEALTRNQENFLYSEMKQITDALFSYNKNKATWMDYIDAESLAKFYIVQEITDNYESFHGSCYIYREKGENEKWHFGPVWDFGSSMYESSKSEFVNHARPWYQVWIGEMCQFVDFQQLVKEEWLKFMSNKYGDMNAYIDAYAAKIKNACESDAAVWAARGYNYGNKNEIRKANEVKNWLAGSISWLSGQWGAPVTGSAYIVTDNDINISVNGHVLTVDVQKATDLVITSIDGISRKYSLQAGSTVIDDLQKGVYVVAGKKIVIK